MFKKYFSSRKKIMRAWCGVWRHHQNATDVGSISVFHHPSHHQKCDEVRSWVLH
jgi:hypothetical protein